MTAKYSNEKQNEAQALPLCSILILAINATVFAFMWRAGRGDVASVASLFGAKENARIYAGEWWRFVTPIFLHGGFEHLLVNSLSLFWFGFSMERLYGSRRYLLLYLFAGAVSFMVSYWRSPYPSLGASGAIFGLVGAGLAFPLRYRDKIPEQARSRILSQLLTMAAINLGVGFTLKQVDNWAHLGGLAGGVVAALFLTPEMLDDRPAYRRRDVLLNLSVTTAILLTGLCGALQRNAPKFVSITIHPENPWWSLSAPADWKREGMGFLLPSGASLILLDSFQASEQGRILLEELARSEAPKQAAKAGAFPAARFQERAEDKVAEACVISAYGESIALLVIAPEAALPQAKQEMDQALQGVEIRRAP